MNFIFLDRDGVINEFPGKGEYVTRWEDFSFIPNAIDAIRRLKEAGFEIYVVSNQGCVSRGMITLSALHEMTNRMLKDIENQGGKIDGVFYCIHQTSDQCECKKPKTSLFIEAMRGRPVDWESTYFIGDSQEDVEAGKNLGCRTMLVLSGRTHNNQEVERMSLKPDVVKKDLSEAVHWILEKKS